MKQDRNHMVPNWEKIAYAVGIWPLLFGFTGVQILSGPVYNILLGVSPTLIGLVLGSMRFYDAVTDPLAAMFSDNVRTRWGRRRPFMLVGGILASLSFPLIWFAAPGWSEHAKVVYLICFCLIFYGAHTVFVVPYVALGNEITASYQERTQVHVVKEYFTKAFYFCIPWVFPLAQQDWFGDPITGIRVIGCVCGVVMLGAVIFSSVHTRERYYEVAEKQERVPLFKSLGYFVKDPVMWKLNLPGLSVLAAINLVEFLGYYVQLYYVWGGDLKGGSVRIGTVATVGNIASILLIVALSKFGGKLDKKTIANGALALGIVSAASQWLLFNPNLPWFSLIPAILIGMCYTAFFLAFSAMQGDYCDYDELRNGFRREGAYSALSGWLVKGSTSIAIVFSGIILDSTGFDRSLEGAQGESTFTMMRILLIGIPLICFVIGLITLKLYPLNRQRMEEVRTELEQKRKPVEA